MNEWVDESFPAFTLTLTLALTPEPSASASRSGSSDILSRIGSGSWGEGAEQVSSAFYGR